MELTRINKHVMTDGIHEYYRRANGDWAPGYYDGRKFVWIRTRRYCARHRDYTMPDGTIATLRLSRYTYKRETRRPAYAPLGKNGRQYKRARLETVKDVYYRHGLFYAARNVQREDGTYFDSMAPFSGVMFDAYPEQSERAGIPDLRIWCEDGRPYSVELDGERIDIAPGEWDAMYAPVLQIADVDHEQDHTTVAAEPIEAEPTEEREAFEAARTAWIESTTNTGDQLDLVAWFGYGDASWQELAAPAA